LRKVIEVEGLTFLLHHGHQDKKTIF